MTRFIKIILVCVLLLIFGCAGYFYYINLRGVAPALTPPPADISQPVSQPSAAVNGTGLPLSIPAGFQITVFAKDLGDARVMTWDPDQTLLVSVPSSGKIVALTDINRDGAVDSVSTVISGLNKPHGIAFYRGRLYIAETNGVAVYDYDPVAKRAANRKKIVDLPGGGNHFSRTIGFGPDGRMYLSVGSTCNVCIEKDWRRAKILVAAADGTGLKVYASGLRNSVFFVWRGSELWATNMGRDLIGDDLPPEEINNVVEGADYGWPFCYGKQIQDLTFDRSGERAAYCKTTRPPTIEFQAHSAPLGLAFVPGRTTAQDHPGWPDEFDRSLLVAMHGSWNRTTPTGFKVVQFTFDKNGAYTGARDFITGWLTPKGALGRPVDLLFDSTGNLFISDDKAGVVYRVSPPR